jgi:retinol dehydrogenase 14
MDPRMDGKVALVTGASSGIGKATATRLAAAGARVILVSRTEKRGDKTRQEILKATPGAKVDLRLADLSSSTSIRALAESVNASFDRLDVLVNNAAVLTSRRRVTPEGFELQFFVNHLAYFLLTGLLLEKMIAGAPARIVSVASSAQSSGVIDFDDLQLARNYRGWQAYANTKLMNVVFTYELARRLEGTRVTANCLHPGVIRTNLLRNFSSALQVAWQVTGKLFKQPDEGADTPVYLAASPEVEHESGKYYRYSRPLGSCPESYDREIQRRLWEESERMTGFRYPR